MAVLMYIIVCIAAVNHVLGLASTVIDCKDGGYPGRSTTLTCKTTGTLDSGIFMFRPGGSPLQVILCNRGNTRCRPYGGVTGYSAVVDSPTQITLTIDSFNTATDAGVWTCRDGTSGVPSTCDKSTLRGPDSVTFSPPSPGSVAEGDSLTVTCAASGCNPPCSYSWTQGNQQVSPTSQLKLTNINRSQTGNVYMCTATNSLIPKYKTKQFTLTVYYGPDSVQMNTTSPLTVEEADDVYVSCEATNCSPSCSYTWKFKSQTKSTSYVLSLNNIQRSAAGDYTCTVRNSNTQKSLNKIISLDVQYGSSITSLTLNSRPTNVTVDELTAMTLRCDVDSNPGSHIKLLNNSQTVREVTNSNLANYTWNEAGCLDTGHYTCEAGNKIKSAVSESVQLVVRCSPRLDHRVPFHKEFTVAIGGSVTLIMSVIANPTPTFSWYKLTDGSKNNIGSGSSSTTGVSAVGKLTLINVQQRDIGTYQVVVSNGAKNTDLVKNLMLDVAGHPNIPSDLTVWSSDPHSVSVAWLEGFNGGSEQTFLVQYRVDTTPRWTNLTEDIPEKGVNTIQKAVISDLQSNTRYLVRVLAYNRYGYDDFTKEQEALTLPPGESCLPSSSNEVTGAGIAVGIVIGLAIAAMAATVFAIVWRRGFVCASSKSDGMQPERNVHQHGPLDDTRRGNSTELVHSEDQRNTYEGLGTREDTPYAKMELYDNLKT